MRPSPRFLSFLLTSLLLLSTTPLLASEDPPTSLSATPPFAPACASSAESTEQEDNESYYSSEWDRLSSELAVAYNTFRGMPDGSWNGNTGCFARVNFGIPLSLFSNLINMQVGGSYGVYQWSGRGTSCSCEALESETQGFLTAGLFGTLPSCLDFNMGAVVDGMFNDNFGIFSLSPTLGQVRAQVAVGFCQGHEVGVWGTFATNTAIQSIQHIPVAYKAIDQINLLWRYRYHDCSEVMAWIGTPYTGGLALRNRRPGQLLAGFRIVQQIVCKFPNPSPVLVVNW